jgi:hypothetical protein
MSEFLDQYKANCRAYVRRAPYRFLRLLVAFVAALVLAPICALAARLTGEPMVAAVVGVAGAVGVLAAWIIIERAMQRRAEGPEYPSDHYSPVSFNHDGGQSPFALQPGSPPHHAMVTPGLVPIGHPPAWQTPSPTPAKSSGGGCTIALLVVGGVMMLTCCGGGVAVLAIGTSVAGHVNGRVAVQEDPFSDFQRRQERQIEDLVRRQQDHWREIERDRQRIGRGPDW